MRRSNKNVRVQDVTWESVEPLVREPTVALLTEVIRLLPSMTRSVVVVSDGPEAVTQCVISHLPGCTVSVLTQASLLVAEHGLSAETQATLQVDAAILIIDPSAGDIAQSRVLGQAIELVGRLVAPMGVIVGLVPARTSPLYAGGDEYQRRHFEVGLSTKQIEACAKSANLRISSLRTISDPSLEPIRLPLDGRTVDLSVRGMRWVGVSGEEVDDLLAQRYLFTAVHANASRLAPNSVVLAVSDDVDRAHRWIATARPWLEVHGVELIVAGTCARTVFNLASASLGAFEVLDVQPPSTTRRLFNAGARRAAGEFVAFLDDTVEPDSTWFAQLLTAAQSAGDIGAVAGKTLREDGTIDAIGYAFGPRLPFHHVPYLLYGGVSSGAPEASRRRTLGALRSLGMLVRRDVFARLGGFDEGFDGPLGDVDLSLRIRSRRCRLLFEPASMSRSSSGMNRGSGPARDALSLLTAEKLQADAEAARRDQWRFARKWGDRIPFDDVSISVDDGTDLDTLRTPPADATSDGVPIVWSGVLLDDGGYGTESREFVLGLDEAGVDVSSNPIIWQPLQSAPRQADLESLERMIAFDVPSRFVHVIHSLPSFMHPGETRPVFERAPGALLNVGRTMFETDRIPEDWIDLCNKLDEVWVASAFNVETFAASGVDRRKLHVIPSPIDDLTFNLSVDTLALPGSATFTFLSVFGWSLHKGWDVLVRAFVEEFELGEAKLVIKANRVPGVSVVMQRDRVTAYVSERLGRDPRTVPEIVFLDLQLSLENLARLYRSVDAFVLPSRGEGWGRPYMEAMAMQLPTVATRWGGNVEFMTDENSYLVDFHLTDVPVEGYEEIAQYEGHRWAEPSVTDVRAKMRDILVRPAEAKRRGRRARSDVLTKFSREHVANLVVARLEASGVPPRRTGPPRSMRPLVVWEGPMFVEFGIALANRELCRRLARASGIELIVAAGESFDVAVALDRSLEPVAAAAARRPTRAPDVTVRHMWPPNFERPESGLLVLFQPWEYGSLPQSWIAPMNTVVDEVWVPSQYVRDCFLRSGVDPDRVIVMPLGVDTERFRPGLAPVELGVDKGFKFLSVGGTLHRKGADTLLEAYLSTFGPADDVALVIKDFGSHSFYAGQGLAAQIHTLQADPRLASLLYLEMDLSSSCMAGLYAACDCLVHPYRGEGYGLPITEAMASGLPVIVPRHGAALDYCDDTSAYLVAATEVRASSQILSIPTVGPPWWAEIDKQALSDAMRQVVAQPQAAAMIGARAAERMQTEHTWAAASDRILQRLEAIAHSPGSLARPSAAAPPTTWSKPRGLSVCMIVKDEETLLGRALSSVAAIADEVVVVDTGSTDRTLEIARAAGALVTHAVWQDDFAAARNEALSHASYAWILMLDGDQWIDEKSHAEIRRIVQTVGPVGFLLRQRNYQDREGEASILEHLVVRLFPNRDDIRYAGAVHEQLVCTTPKSAWQVALSDVVIHHEGSRPQHHDESAIAARDRRILEGRLRDAPGDRFAAYNLGVAYRVLGNIEEAVAKFEQSLGPLPQLPGDRSTSTTLARPSGGAHGEVAPVEDDAVGYRLSARIELARALLALGRFDEAVHVARRAVVLAPSFPDAHAVLAATLVGKGRLEEAYDEYRATCQEAAGEPPAPTDRSLVAWKGILGMAQVRVLQQRFDDAQELLEQARSASGGHPLVEEWFMHAASARASDEEP
jgi:glycosyltransferase involved in cell wall biosynthesis